MSETLKVFFLLDKAETSRKGKSLLQELRKGVQQVATNPEYQGYSFKNIGISRVPQGIRVTLYFIRDQEAGHLTQVQNGEQTR